MKKTDRQAIILEKVSSGNEFNIVKAASELKVSEETIRRDIKELENKGLVQRKHGGATLPNTVVDGSFQSRLKLNSEGKRKIGAAVSELITDGDSVLIETGTTTTFVAQSLRDKKSLTVVTNSADVARCLAVQKENDVYMAGGKLSTDDAASLGPTAIDYISKFYVSYAVVSAAGLDPDAGVTVNKVAEAEFSRHVISRAKQVILVADQTKFGRCSLVSVCDFSQIDILVTDATPSDELKTALNKANVETIIA
ncbi:DeoR/GlpR family DNA-binding transcription regulator [Vibrio nigripulchritudo]|uniref:DeoR/GlpR family DNA-binding transcription regulator n=1 Tax=Vibrio nigripulchritudo TaxID=28173 RepID=UPI0024909F36|nr:DeoR/GlpR family DNA-binding transcription regulator [Vibrio nigripulchritudo]BDU41176.1 DeoR family transcriptional regulator [Vibrio nigripulchritudo]BDU46941.1 DeoR family transcriptional regulator [Vibrio nigripulchritudo]